MRQVLRAFISLLVCFELLFGALFAGGSVRAELPDVPAGAYGQYVDPFTGTGGVPWMCGMVSPAASAPFGCVRVGPDTGAVGGVSKIKLNTSGYYYGHRHIRGFSCGRLSGTGAQDYGMFRVMPALGLRKGKQAPALPFLHAQEQASPGYYAVYLPGAACLCEMTAATRTAVQRYTFRSAKDAVLYIDAAAQLPGGRAKNVSVSVDSESRTMTMQATLFGTFAGRYGGLTVYGCGAWDAPCEADIQADGVQLRFGNLRGKSVTLRIGVSFTSAEAAAENLRAETDGKEFDAVRAETAALWETRLSSIRLDADEETKHVFYTALYHTMLMPTDFTDTDGRYLGFDGAVHDPGDYTYRTDMSLWDTARNVHALYTLISPDVQHDCLESLLEMAREGGVLPRWPMGAGYSGSMFGNPADVVFAESLLKGVPFDAEEAYAFMKKSSDGVHEGAVDRDGAELYNAYGYLPDDAGYDYSVSKTLEYSWEDAALAAMAQALGHDDEAAYYAARSQNYKNIWDDETQFFRPRNRDGSWGRLIPRVTSFFDDVFGTDVFRAYCEGSARQWQFGTTQDPDALVELFGSDETFARTLDRFMRDAAPRRGDVNPGSGFWIGNQHDIHTPYLFLHAGRADLTQKWVRWTLRERFAIAPDGLDGNDDGGTLSAWYVFSAMGFYPIAGTDRYWIGSPCIDGATLRLDNGKTLTVRVNNQDKDHFYVQSVTWNGESMTEMFLTHAQIAAGGELTFTMTK